MTMATHPKHLPQPPRRAEAEMTKDRLTGVSSGRFGAVSVQCLPVDEITSKLQASIDVMMLGLEPGYDSMIVGNQINNRNHR
jgi:hypothetical protein